MIKIYVDAATHTEKKLSGGGIVFIENGKQTQHSFPLYATNNHEAEFEVLLLSLKILLEQEKTNESIFLFSDSKTVVASLDKGFTKNPRFIPYLTEFLELEKNFSLLIVQWIPENQNKGADNLARQGLQKSLKINKGHL
ncbi:ribonuclease HI [Pilibacter termitis]|uniref:Ribonuclease HI n=1 Tax=Pilibacter termitis TaxID=263852 RepID=A0A1T4K7U3_9ENTE|nr:ribonuclease HI family protein [Pilibacter termitis]SJZ38518.1 ribonuclease HI [Pilibacter termitis]